MPDWPPTRYFGLLGATVGWPPFPFFFLSIGTGACSWRETMLLCADPQAFVHAMLVSPPLFLFSLPPHPTMCFGDQRNGKCQIVCPCSMCYCFFFPFYFFPPHFLTLAIGCACSQGHRSPFSTVYSISPFFLVPPSGVLIAVTLTTTQTTKDHCSPPSPPSSGPWPTFCPPPIPAPLLTSISHRPLVGPMASLQLDSWDR